MLIQVDIQLIFFIFRSKALHHMVIVALQVQGLILLVLVKVKIEYIFIFMPQFSLYLLAEMKNIAYCLGPQGLISYQINLILRVKQLYSLLVLINHIVNVGFNQLV